MAKTNYGHTPTQKEIKEHLYRKKKAEAANAVARANIPYKGYGLASKATTSAYKGHRSKLISAPENG